MFFIIGNNLIEMAANNGDLNIAAGAQESGVPRQSADILAVDSITVNSFDTLLVTSNLQTVDFVDGLIIPTQFEELFTSDRCSGGPEELYFNDFARQFCYCTTFGFVICAQTMRSYFPY